MKEYIELKIDDWREWLPKYHGKEIEFSKYKKYWEKDILTGVDTSSHITQHIKTQKNAYFCARIKNPDYKKLKYSHSDIINGWLFYNGTWRKTERYRPEQKEYFYGGFDFTFDELQEMAVKPEPPEGE